MILIVVIMWKLPINIIINVANLDILQFIWYQILPNAINPIQQQWGAKFYSRNNNGDKKKKKKKKKPVPEHGLKFYLREDSSPNKQIPF